MTKVPRTKGFKSQNAFDNILKDIGVSGLTFLKQKYDNDLAEFRNTHDLNEQDNAQEYKEMQQRAKMISEELHNRVGVLEDDHLFSKDIHFNDNYDIVVEEPNGDIKLLRPSLHKDGSIEIYEIDEDEYRN